MKSPLLRSLVVALPALFALGCVPLQQFETVKGERDRYRDGYNDLSQKYNKALQQILVLEKHGATSLAMVEKVKNLEDLNKDLTARLQQMATTPITKTELPRGLEGKVEIEPGGIIGIREDVLFNSGEALLKGAGARQVLDELAGFLAKEHPNEIIHITGHTDTDPLKVTKARWEYQHNLAYNRAYTVFKYFLERGLLENHMIIHSAAYLQPIADNETKEGKARNRRVTIGLGGVKF